MTSRATARRSAAVLMSGALLGLVAYVLDSTWDRHAAGDADRTTPHASAHTVANGPSARSGVFVMTESPGSHRFAAAARATEVPAQAQEPPFPFSFLGKIDEEGATTILLYGAGRTLKVRSAGPLDDHYVVDDVFDDRVVVRYLPLGTRHVVELESRQYAIPGSLRGEYPQD